MVETDFVFMEKILFSIFPEYQQSLSLKINRRGWLCSYGENLFVDILGISIKSPAENERERPILVYIVIDISGSDKGRFFCQ